MICYYKRVNNNKRGIITMTITVSIKNVYGNDLIYPVCDKAIQFAKLTGKKTFSKHDLNIRVIP